MTSFATYRRHAHETALKNKSASPSRSASSHPQQALRSGLNRLSDLAVNPLERSSSFQPLYSTSKPPIPDDLLREEAALRLDGLVAERELERYEADGKSQEGIVPYWTVCYLFHACKIADRLT